MAAQRVSETHSFLAASPHEVSVTSPPEREIARDMVGAMHHSTGSYELVIAAIAAAGLGLLIDSLFGIVPIFTLIFAVVGFIGATYSIWLKYQADMTVASDDRTSRSNRVSERGTSDPSHVDRAPSQRVGGLRAEETL